MVFLNFHHFHHHICLVSHNNAASIHDYKANFTCASPWRARRIVASSTESSMHPMPSSGRVRFCPRPRACECWTALLDPYGSLQLVASRKPSARCGCKLLLRRRAVLHGTLNFIGKIHCRSLILENWVLSYCPLQQFTTLCGMHESCGMLTTTKRSTLGANAV